MAYPPQGGGGGISWQDVVNNLKTQGALNKEYDPSLAGLIPASKLGFSFAWEKVAEVEASAAAQEINVTGLAGDTDLYYLVLVALTPVSSTSDVSHFIIFNADTTIGNYEWTAFGVGSTNAWGGSVQGFGATSGNPGLPFIQVYAGHIGGVGWALVHAKGVTIGTETYVTAVGLPGSLRYGWKISSCAWKKSAEVTEISLYCPAGSYIGEGTKMIVFKPKW